MEPKSNFFKMTRVRYKTEVNYELFEVDAIINRGIESLFLFEISKQKLFGCVPIKRKLLGVGYMPVPEIYGQMARGSLTLESFIRVINQNLPEKLDLQYAKKIFYPLYRNFIN